MTGSGSSRPNAARIGLFAIGALLLLIVAVALVFGGRVFANRETVVMHFAGSVHGLEVGAPVVLRGVRVGTVSSIELDLQGAKLAVPVRANIDAARLGAPGLQGLLTQGLTAQLATSSLLTGQLYVDLDLRPKAQRSAPPSATGGDTAIPTTAPRFEGLQSQLEALDLSRISQDLGAVLARTRALAESPQTAQTLLELSRSAAALAQVSATLERRVGPLADRADKTLAQTADAAQRLAQGVAGAADKVGGAASRVDTLLAPGAPLVSALQNSAEELARTARALSAATAPEGATAQQLQNTLAEVNRAARSVRELATLLQEQPEAVLRGRRADPGAPP
jgi:paraquat-inducible protein B